MKKTIFITFLFATASAPAAGQFLKQTETDAIKTGGQSGQIAGGGYFCQMDGDELDDFITMAHARIATQAVDKVDRVVAQLEFSNNYSAWSARPPEEGCELFLQKFSQKFADLFQKK